MELEDLEKDLRRRADRINERARQKYHLARRLGFSARESMILQNRSEETIHRLANERAKKAAK